MRESVLRDYFLGVVDESHLTGDLAGSVVTTSYDVITHHVSDDLVGQFEVNSNHLIGLCDAFLEGKLKAEDLELIGFALEASEHFLWDKTEDSPVAETVHAWASPEINYPLTAATIAKFKHLLLTGETLFTKCDVSNHATKIED